jgi:hypothetical protein
LLAISRPSPFATLTRDHHVSAGNAMRRRESAKPWKRNSTGSIEAGVALNRLISALYPNMRPISRFFAGSAAAW